MTDERVKELQDFTDDFRRRLSLAKESYEKSSSKSIEIEKDKSKERRKLLHNYKIIKKNKSQRILNLRKRKPLSVYNNITFNFFF